ncbi:MAG: hypothetical protein JXB29_13305 [Sedimentisphaerales bacterium]|nr:hypothetical protein [Sedimentisphaerales bacterium]
MNAEQLVRMDSTGEKYTSAMTLSDMEIFVFPELMYALVLANIMSPVIWQWRQLDCFKKLKGKSSYRKLMRLKQFIMDEFEFNLDLETWGLTGKDKELQRFSKFITPEEMAKSNALFGYHGDKYYFDVDIRRHFGLDKYNDDIIPYWKTETVEAMNAFRLKQGYKTGAGECVSLAALYAAAAFVICGIPLEDIFMILTPLHSQNFFDLNDGILTNNRRLVTKTMWFNGSPISNKAQRALRNENITIVAHSSGYIHCLYEDATIDSQAYKRFTAKLKAYLSAEFSLPVIASFLRANRDYQKFFQVCRDCHGHTQFLKAELLFHYEHNSNYRIGEKTFDKLLAEVSEEDFVTYQLPNRIRCDQLELFIEKQKIDLKKSKDKDSLTDFFAPVIPQPRNFVKQLADFIHIEPQLPSLEKNFVTIKPIEIDVKQKREEIISYLQSIRQKNDTADLAFYAFRDMKNCSWLPFVKAAIQRNPVSVQMTESMSLQQTFDWLANMPNDSIYDNARLAQPDEVVNYLCGDGVEKALVLANVIHQRNRQQQIEITVDNSNVILKAEGEYHFVSDKGFNKKLDIPEDTNFS